MKKIVHAYIHRETMTDIAQDLSMNPEPYRMLEHFSEVELEIEFDTETGLVNKAKVTGPYAGGS